MEETPNSEISQNERATLLLTDFLGDAKWAVAKNPSFEVRYRAKPLKGDRLLQVGQARFTGELETLFGLVKMVPPNPFDKDVGFSAQWYLKPNIVDNDPTTIELAIEALKEALDETG